MFSGFVTNVFVLGIILATLYRLRVWMLQRYGKMKVVVNNYQYRGILLLTGIPGSGKTYKMINLMLESLAQGREVRINFNVRYDMLYVALATKYKMEHGSIVKALRNIVFLDSWEDYIDAYDCDVYIDEAQDVLDSQYWQYIPHEMVTWGAQHRHRRCRIVLAAHRFGKIHSYWRELIARIELARPAAFYMKPFYNVTRGNKYPLLQYVGIKDPEEEVGSSPRAKRGIINKFGSWSLVPLDPMIANCYDHEGGVRPSPLAKLLKELKKEKIQLDLKPRRIIYRTSDIALLESSVSAITLEEFLEGHKPLDYGQWNGKYEQRKVLEKQVESLLEREVLQFN